jgi:hypothetical protein
VTEQGTDPSVLETESTTELSAPPRPRKSRRKKPPEEGESDFPEGMPFLKPAPTETRSLTVVLRACGRHQSRALMLTRLAQVAMEEFLGNEGRPPTKLLQLPNGARFQVEPDDALELHMDLIRMSLEDRYKLQLIERAGVQVDPNAVDIKPVASAVGVPGPADECVVDNPRSRAASQGGVAKGSPSSHARPAPPVTRDEFERAVGVTGAATK